MNWLDLVIVGTVALLALKGHRSGILMPASGVGGLVMGVFLAVGYQDQVSAALSEHITEPLIRTLVTFVAIVLATTIAMRVAASVVRDVLGYLSLTWVDRAVGAVAGALLGTIALGTLIYLISGADLGELRQPLVGSSFAGPITSASIIYAGAPWCSEEVRSSDSGDCADLGSLTEQLIGGSVTERLSAVLGHDVETLAEVVGTSLTGSTEDLTRLASERK